MDWWDWFDGFHFLHASSNNYQGLLGRKYGPFIFAPMKYQSIKSLVCLILFWGFAKVALAQDIVINELHNGGGQSDEWTELVVVKDNLSLVDWYLGDNNAATDSWQPKIKFKNHSLWQNLRAGTIIIIDHAANNAGCNDPVDTDKNDGFIRVCCRNTTYFSGGTTNTLFLADEGDFVQIVDPSGKMIHALGYDNDPGTSVLGGNCFTVSSNWTNTTSARDDTRPCGNFLFYRYQMESPTSLKVICGNTTDFYAGMQNSTNNPFIDTTDLETFLGIGNSLANNNWITKLRAPLISSQQVCAIPTPQGGKTFSWLGATDPFPSDNSIGYLILRADQDVPFPSLQQGREYGIGQIISNGDSLASVTGILNNSGLTIFTDNSIFSQNAKYRIYAFRYVNTVGFQHSSRGRSYNLENYIDVNNGQGPQPVVHNDTLCGPGLATLYIDPIVLPGPGQIRWFAGPSGGNPIAVNKDTLKILVTADTSYWVEIQSAANCSNQRFRVRAKVNNFDFTFFKPDSVCEGTNGFFYISSPAVLQPKWTLLNPIPGVLTSKSDSASWEIQIPYFAEKKWLKFTVEVKSETGCLVKKTDSLYTVPFKAALVISPPNPVEGDTVTLSFNSQPPNYYVSDWNIQPNPISENPNSARLIAFGDSLRVNAIIETIGIQDLRFCKIKNQASVKINEKPAPEPEPNPLKPINTLISANGDLQNKTLDFDRREVRNLEIFNRWGKKIHSATLYQNDWFPDGSEDGCYFYSAEIREDKTKNFTKVNGWVMVVR
jgi:hypothetical protein